jgi:hypothetical protein
MILTESEIIELTDKTQHSAQARQLDFMGITYSKRGDGSLVVSARHLAKLLGDNDVDEPSENLLIKPFGGDAPCDWFNKNAKHYIFSKEHIIKNSIAYDRDFNALTPSVYFLIKDSEIVYVGLSVNPNFRIRRHRLEGKIFNRVFVIEFPELILNMLEEFYIHSFCPPLNEYYPPISHCKHLLDAYYKDGIEA